ncbi:MAG: hypothetical protein KDE25_15185 [Novosphingobium sp.]|nr:hypothetical protein [Novosphingobium sp.]
MSVTEADQVVAHVNSHAVFAPIIDEYQVPDMDRLNRDLVAEIRQWQQEDGGMTRSNVSGWHSSGNIFKRTDPAIEKACKHFIEACKPTLERYFTKEQLNNARLDLEGWANINPPHGYNQMHTHDTFDLSGVYFVKIPQTSSEASGALQFLNPSYRYGPYSKLFHAMNPPKFTFRPKEGTLLVFPATMPHWVLPNDEDEDRITLAFNLRMKELSGG